MYSSYQMDIGSEAFKRASVTHGNAVTTAVKIILETNHCDGKERKEMSIGDLKKNENCLLTFFFRNKEIRLNTLLCCKRSVEEQRCWRTASTSVRMAQMGCTTIKPRVLSRCHTRKRWISNKEPNDRMQKKTKDL